MATLCRYMYWVKYIIDNISSIIISTYFHIPRKCWSNILLNTCNIYKLCKYFRQYSMELPDRTFCSPSFSHVKKNVFAIFPKRTSNFVVICRKLIFISSMYNYSSMWGEEMEWTLFLVVYRLRNISILLVYRKGCTLDCTPTNQIFTAFCVLLLN